MKAKGHPLQAARAWKRWVACLVVPLGLAVAGIAADIPGSNDPPGMQRYAGSELIGYRAPKFDEFLLPLGPPSGFSPLAYEKSLKTEGLVSRYAYVAPTGRSTAELLRNYKSVAKSKLTNPTYYYLFVTTYADGVIPEHLQNVITKGRVLAELVVISPQQMQENMAFISAEEMYRSLSSSGKVALYGIYFDTNQDKLRPDSEPLLKEIAKLLSANSQLSIRVVGHTDNQGKPDYNLDLSRRRAAAVVRELESKYAVAANRLDSFGCGLYAPVASNDSEEGRTKNRRVELVNW